jgi:hypothetical protein
MVFKDSDKKTEYHTVFPKGVMPPRKDELGKSLTLRGRFEVLQSTPDGKPLQESDRLIKRIGEGYRYFVVSSWEVLAASNKSAATSPPVLPGGVHADIVWACEVVDEGPLAHGDRSIQKSYRVKHQALWAQDAASTKALPDEAWVHYDLQEYPDQARSGGESEYRKGGKFVAYIHDRGEGEWRLRLIRTEPIERAGEITSSLSDTKVDGPAARPTTVSPER